MSIHDPAGSEVKVSVCMITYNHEAYIAQAIEGVLMQETDFAVELVIGEDCSTDNTRAIVRDYGARHPERIRLLLPERNQGAHANFRATYEACRGQYIALCEGDDYWTDPHKLQKQVEFLEAHPECALCFHDVMIVDETQDIEPRCYPNLDPGKQYRLEDLLRQDFIPTCSTMYRQGTSHELPPWFYSLPMGDWPLHILNAEHGTLGYLPATMGVYRIHPGGIWSGRSLVRRIEGHILMYRAVNRHLQLRYTRIISHEISFNYYWLAAEYLAQGDRGYAIKNLIRSVVAAPLQPGAPYPLLVRMMLKALLNRHYRFFRAIKHGRNALQESIHDVQGCL